MFYTRQHGYFQKEIQVGLLGNHAFNTWKQQGILTSILLVIFTSVLQEKT